MKKALLYWLACFWITACHPGGSGEKLFTSIGEPQTGITFSNTVKETEALNINSYLYAHNGGGVAVGDINQDGLPDLYFTGNQVANRLYLNQGNFTFQDITNSAGVAGFEGADSWTTGAVMADVNGDGWLDIYVCQVTHYNGFQGHNQLFINNGAQSGESPTFTESAEDYNLAIRSYAQQAAFFDYDRDGDLDMYLLNHAVHNTDTYVKAAQRSQKDSLAGDRLLRNDEGRFQDVTEASGIYSAAMGYGLALGIGDIDDNGCPDIYVSNDFHENDYVYYNNGDGTFREDVKGTLGHTSTFSMGNDIADFNNDGLLDIITMDMKPEEEVIRKKSVGADPFDIYNYKLSFGYYYQYPRNMLHLNRGNLFADNVQFSEIGQLAGIDATDWSWSTLMADFDNDGWKDIFITNGILRRPNDLDYINFAYAEAAQSKTLLELAHMMPEGAAPNYAYKNTGDLRFKNVSSDWGLDETGYSMGAAYGDLDNDGDLDLVVNQLNAPAVVYRNNAEKMTGNHYLKIRLEGKQPNGYGIGSRVVVEADAKKMMQELHPTRGWLSSVDYALNFGLGTAEKINRIQISWPDGSRQTVEHVPVDQTLTIRQEGGQPEEAQPLATPPLFSDVTNQAGIAFQHQENNFSDFNNERLLPHSLTHEGPRIAVADVNQDGLEDFFVGGAAGQSGELYLQKSGASLSFTKGPGAVFSADQEKEDVAAAFFDADGDGDQDLYVVSGGGQYLKSVHNQDRLYVNDGQGNFVKVALPEITANGSCVVAADFNGDSHIDILVGTRSLVGAYGRSPDSYLLWNNGNGQFQKDTSAYAKPLQKLGMVTDAVWLPEAGALAVVGEWMPITFLTFTASNIQKREITNTAGWWNTITAADLNNDGKLDLLAGNMGLNSDLKASTHEPVRLYVQDIDQNQSVDPILTYFRDQKEWVYTDLSVLQKQVPSIRSRYRDYASFAQHTFSQVFPEATRKQAEVKQAQMFQSVYLLNQGDETYDIREFPLAIQSAPIFSFAVQDFNEDGISDILAAGNFYGNMPGLGRYDASYGHYLQGKGDGTYVELEPRKSGFAVYGEVRDMQILSTATNKNIIISRNNAIPKVIKSLIPIHPEIL